VKVPRIFRIGLALLPFFSPLFEGISVIDDGHDEVRKPSDRQEDKNDATEGFKKTSHCLPQNNACVHEQHADKWHPADDENLIERAAHKPNLNIIVRLSGHKEQNHWKHKHENSADDQDACHATDTFKT
jgi:hypothetical protein